MDQFKNNQILNKNHVRVLTLLFALFFLGCQPSDFLNSDSRLEGGFALNSIESFFLYSEQVQIQIVDNNGHGVSGVKAFLSSESAFLAEGTIGQSVANSEGVWITGDLNGYITLTHDLLNYSLMTVSAQGYLPTTYQNISWTQGLVFPIEKDFYALGAIHVLAQPKGFKTQKDGQVDFGISVSSANRDQILGFHLNMILSPFSEMMEILGQDFTVPSNLAFPEQDESYIFPFTMEKSKQSIRFLGRGQKTFVTLSGRFPVKPVFDAMRNDKSFSDIMNYFDMKGATVTGCNLQSDNQQQSVTINEQKIEAEKTFKLPAVFNPASEMLVAVSFSELQDKSFIPVDIRRIESNTKPILKTLGPAPLLLNVKYPVVDLSYRDLVKTMSSRFVSWEQESVAPEMLPFLKSPKILSDSSMLEIELPQLPTGLADRGMLVELSLVIEQEVGVPRVEGEEPDREGEMPSDQATEKVNQIRPLRKIYLSQWQDKVIIKNPEGLKVPKGKKRWSVTLMAGPTIESSNSKDLRADESASRGLIELFNISKVTHVTYSAKDF